jgi:predicted nuclease with TOPRIM domain
VIGILQEELIQKTLKLESDNQELLGRVQSVLDEKCTDTESLQHEITKRDLQADTFEKQISELRSFLDEKEQLYISSMEREKSLEEQKLQVCVYYSCKSHDIVFCKTPYNLHLLLRSKHHLLQQNVNLRRPKNSMTSCSWVNR